MFDFSKATIIVDDKLIDKKGNPIKEVLILQGNRLKCHPDMKEKLEEAINLFFKKENKNE